MPTAATTPSDGQIRCRWCGHAADAAARSCPACGAPLDVRAAVTRSGWTELPAIRDMAKIQLGRSFCQIEGINVPIADFNLAAGDGIYFAHHLLLWKDDQVQISAMSLGGAWKRLLSGMPLVMTQAAGPGRIAFSKDKPGELIALPLQPGQSVDVREHVFMIATSQVQYSWFQSGIWFSTRNDKDTETHYPVGMFLDKFSAADSPGLLLLHGGGNVFVRQLEAGQSILIKPTSFLFKDPTVRINLHFEFPAGSWSTWGNWGNRYLWLNAQGPGRVAVQSNYEPLEDPGRNLAATEPYATRHQW